MKNAESIMADFFNCCLVEKNNLFTETLIYFYFTFFVNKVMSQNTSKKKCRQYSVEYLKFDFITALHNEQKPLCLICEKKL